MSETKGRLFRVRTVSRVQIAPGRSSDRRWLRFLEQTICRAFGHVETTSGHAHMCARCDRLMGAIYATTSGVPEADGMIEWREYGWHERVWPCKMVS